MHEPLGKAMYPCRATAALTACARRLRPASASAALPRAPPPHSSFGADTRPSLLPPLSSPRRTMSSLTPTFRYINADELAEIIKADPQGAGRSWAVIDVRDSDFAGGNIVGALNYPSDTFLARMDELVKNLDGVPKVVFHCALSQVRGPKAARRYVEGRDLILKDQGERPAQEVLVLREGFTGFQTRYRDDPVLVEKFNKYYHS